MLALFAGEGRLPNLIEERLEREGERCIRLDLNGNDAARSVSLNTLGSTLISLKAKGCQRICLAGRVDRRALQLNNPDEETRALLPVLAKALQRPDGGALEKVHALLEMQGFQVVAAHDVCPDLLPEPGILTQAAPGDADVPDVDRAFAVLDQMGIADVGQGCVVENGQVLALEALPGTDFMLQTVARFRGTCPKGGVFAKAAKAGQDLRSDMPVIGEDTAEAVCAAGLAGIVVKAGEVMVLDREAVVARLNKEQRFLWVRP